MNKLSLLTKTKIVDLPIETRLKIYNEALKLKNKNFEPLKIWKILKNKNLEIKYDTLLTWINGIRNPLRNLNIIKKFDEKLVYIIGVLLGDGCAYKVIKNGFYIQGNIHLCVKDKEFAEKFASFLTYIFDRQKPYKIFWSRSLKLYALHTTSKHLVEIFDRSLSELKSIIEINPLYFLKGLYDSEGSVTIKFTKNKKVYPRVFFTINDKELLLYVRKLLKKFDINSTIQINTPARKVKYIVNKKTSTKICYNLGIENLKGVFLFSKLINFTIKRKRDKLNKIVALIKEYGTDGAFKRYKKL